MRGDHVRAGDLQHHLQQGLHVQPEDGTTVGMQVANGFEPCAEGIGGSEIRHVDQAVDLADPAVFPVDRTDLGFQDELRFLEMHAGKLRYLAGGVFCGKRCLQTKKSRAVVQFQRLAQFLPPCRMGEIAGGKDVHALCSGPCREISDGKPRAGGPGETRMDVQVGSEHGRCFPVGLYGVAAVFGV